MEIIDHGEWVACDKPENYPVKLPDNIIFSRRISDGADWYIFQRQLIDAKGLLVIAIPTEDGGLSVATTTHDPSMLFPTAGMRLFEVIDAPADHESLRTLRIDLKEKRFLPRPPPPPTMMQVLIEELGLDADKLQARLDQLTNNRSRKPWLT
jgi:hypothetical protein